MAIKFTKKEPEPAPAAEKAKKRDVQPPEGATEFSPDTAPPEKQSRAKSKKSGKTAAEKEDELF
ncbi:MAG: hypothetical protein JWM58_2227 [Rhizobium sp.]|nr:hypothetical protein [Rhizobium sp.]